MKIIIKALIFSAVLSLQCISNVYAQNNIAVVPEQGGGKVAILKDGALDRIVTLRASNIGIGFTAMSADGQYAYFVDRASQSGFVIVSKFNLSTLQEETILSLPVPNGWSITDVEISRDGTKLAISCDNQANVTVVSTAGNMKNEGTVRLCQRCDGQTLSVNAPAQLSFSYDSKQLRVAYYDTVEVLDVSQPGMPVSIETINTGMAVGATPTDIANYQIPGLDHLVAVSYRGVLDGTRIVDTKSGTAVGPYNFGLLGDTGPHSVTLHSVSSLLLAARGSMTYGRSQVSDKMRVNILNVPGLYIDLPATEAVREVLYDSKTNTYVGPCQVLGTFCMAGPINVWDMNTLSHQVVNTGLPITPTHTSAVNGYYYAPNVVLSSVFALNLSTKQGVNVDLTALGPFFGIYGQGQWEPRPADF